MSKAVNFIQIDNGEETSTVFDLVRIIQARGHWHYRVLNSKIGQKKENKPTNNMINLLKLKSKLDK